MTGRRDAGPYLDGDMPDDEHLLAALRSDDETARAAARQRLAPAALGANREQSAALRANVARSLASALLPTDRPVARWLLQAEATALRMAGSGESETLYTLATALARFANPDDALALWQAHDATPETRNGLDVELLGRLGIEQVRARLRPLSAEARSEYAEDARDALAWLDEGEREGAFDDLAGYFTWAEERFGVRVAGPV